MLCHTSNTMSPDSHTGLVWSTAQVYILVNFAILTLLIGTVTCDLRGPLSSPSWVPHGSRQSGVVLLCLTASLPIRSPKALSSLTRFRHARRWRQRKTMLLLLTTYLPASPLPGTGWTGTVLLGNPSRLGTRDFTTFCSLPSLLLCRSKVRPTGRRFMEWQVLL